MENIFMTIMYFVALGTVFIIAYGVGEKNGYEKGKSEGWRQCEKANKFKW